MNHRILMKRYINDHFQLKCPPVIHIVDHCFRQVNTAHVSSFLFYKHVRARAHNTLNKFESVEAQRLSGQSSPRYKPATELQDTQDKSYGRRAKSRSTSFFVCRNITMPCGNAARNFSPRRYPQSGDRSAGKNFYLSRCLCQNRGARYRFKPDHGLTGRQ